jgi:hypothetical protein
MWLLLLLEQTVVNNTISYKQDQILTWASYRSDGRLYGCGCCRYFNSSSLVIQSVIYGIRDSPGLVVVLTDVVVVVTSASRR